MESRRNVVQCDENTISRILKGGHLRYKEASKQFQDTVRSKAIQSMYRMTFKDYSEEGDLVLDEDKGLSSEDCVITDACYNEGQLIGTAMCKEAEIQVINDNYDLADKEFQLEVGVDTSSVVLNGPDEYDVTVDIPVGKSEQKTRSGKNLFNKNGDFTYGNTNYKTTLQADGTLLSTANFTNNRSAGLLIENLKQNTIYTVSGTLISADGTATNNAIIEVLSTENVGLNRYYILATEIKPFNFVFYFNTGTNSSAYISLSGIGPTTQTSTNTVFDKIQIEEGNTVTDYEEYGVSPSPEYPSPIHSLGDDVNLLNIYDNHSEGYSITKNGLEFTFLNNGGIKLNGTATKDTSIDLVGVYQSGNYKINFNDKYIASGLYNGVRLLAYNGTTLFSTFENNISQEVNNQMDYMLLAITPNIKFDNVIIYPKLQKGKVETPYSEYGKGTVTIEQRGKNLLKGLSTPLDDTNYWYATTPSYFTPLEDGWGKFEYDNTNGTGTIFINAKVKQSAVKLKPNSTYTIITEIRNSSISENSGAFFQLITNNATTSSSENKNLSYSQINKEGTYKSKFLTKPDFSKVEVAIDTYLRLAVGTKGKVEARISLVEGDIDITDFDYEPYFSKDYVLQVSEPLRSLPNGIKDTIEEDGIHRRVGIGKFQAVNQLYDSRGFKYGTNSIKSINTSAENINIICDKAICNVVNAKTNDIYITNYGNTLVIFGETDDTVETFNAKFAGAEYIYELAEEVIEPIFKEYIPYGTYTVKQYEDVKSNNKYKIVSYDYMDKLNEEFVDNDNYPKTLKQFYIDFAGYYGLEVEEQTLPNENFIIKEKPALENMTGRSILGCIAELFGSFAKINRFDRIQMYLKEDTDIEFSLDDMNSKLETDNRYGPVNVVTIGLSSVEGENVTLQDEESIAQYGETTIRIDDNPFVYTEALREEVIEELYNRLKGFSYVPVSFNHKARLYTDCGDAIKVQNMEETGYVETMILNQTIKIPRTRQSTIETKALTNTQQEKKYISKTKQKNTQTEIVVDKINQNIVGIIETQDEIQDKIFKMESDISGLDVSLTTAGGNNFLSFAPEYWELEIQQKLQEGIEEIGSFEGITETSLNNLLNTTITNYEKTDTSITFNYNQNKILIDTDLSITANVNLESISSRSTYYEELRKNTISSLGYLLKNENILQRLILPNGIYTISFLYKTVSLGATNKLIIDNGIKTEYELEDIQNFTDFKIQTEVEQEDGTTGTEEHYLSFEVNNNEVSIGFSSDSDNAIIISDLMLNSGSTKLDWTQNSNETITDTVKIGKGIEISSTADDVKFKADTDGIRILDADTDEVTSKFTRAGTETNNLIAHNSANLGGLMFRKVNDKVWITFIPDD